MKYHQEGDEGGGHRRSPCGERGLKFLLHRKAQCTTRSLPVRGAWIEIQAEGRGESAGKSLPVRGAWIEITCRNTGCEQAKSLPVRGAWIEMEESRSGAPGLCRRSPCGERGLKSAGSAPGSRQASRSPCGERGLKYDADVSVSHLVGRSPCGERGLKYDRRSSTGCCDWSLPVRGAWIEIVCVGKEQINRVRRSPCGERGLKSQHGRWALLPLQSLPVRGAWIEMRLHFCWCCAARVAPRAGSVD